MTARANVGGEEGPDGHAGGWGDFVGPEEAGAAVLAELDAEVPGVPGGEGFGVAGFEEDAAYAGDSGHGFSCGEKCLKLKSTI